jgi:hypothetical protein
MTTARHPLAEGRTHHAGQPVTVATARAGRARRVTARVVPPGCPCDRRWGHFGLLYGISMGHGWIRTSTDPDCPEHGIEAERARAIRNGWPVR